MNQREIIRKAFKTGFLHIMGAGTLNKILTFANSLFVVRLVSKGDYGVYAYAESLFAMFCIINGVGMDSALLQICSEKYSNEQLRNNLFYWGCKIFIISSLFVSALIGICSSFMSFKIPGTEDVLMLMLLLPLFDGIKALQLIKCRIEQNNKEYAFLTNLDTIVLVICSVSGAYFFGIKGILAARYISSCFTIAFASIHYGINVFSRHEGIEQVLKTEVIRIGMIMTLNNGLTCILAFAGTIILAVFVPDENVIASYKIASTIPMALLFIPQYLMVYFIPMFARESENGSWLRKTYKSIFLYFGGFNLLVCLISFVFAPIIVKIIFGSNYMDSVNLFRVMMIAYFVQATLRIPSANLLVTQKKLWINVFVSSFGATINIALNCILIPLYASFGAAFAYLLTFLFSGVVLTLVWVRRIRKVA